jgi:phosphoribosylanthranilate isomerase
MALITTVKVSGINNLSDARYCAGMGAAMLGFDCNPASANYLPPEKVREIAGWVAGVELVGEVAGPSLPDHLASYPFTAWQVADEAALAALQATGLPIWYALELASPADLALAGETMIRLAPQVAGFLLLGAGLRPDGPVEAQLQALAARFPLLVGFGIGGDNVQRVLERVRPLGVALQGGHELGPGLGDLDALAEVLELLEAED